MVNSVAAGYALGRPFLWRSLFTVGAGVLLCLWAASLIQDLILFRSGAGPQSKIWLLDADSEQSALTWASILSLFVTAQLLFGHGQDALAVRRRPALPWFGLAALFVFLSLDEFASLHEKASAFLQSGGFGGSGLLHFAWAAPAGLLAVLGLIALGPFLASLGQRTRRLALVSAVLYLSGAVGTEMVGGFVADQGGIDTVAYRLAANAEEGLELCGILLFIYALLAYRELLEPRSF